MLISIIAIFVIANVIIILSTFFSYSNFQKCVNFENTNCPTILCNGSGSDGSQPSKNETGGVKAKDGTYPALCWPYAFRPVGDPTNPDTYQCSQPFVGAVGTIPN
jgi:hypothetical protein